MNKQGYAEAILRFLRTVVIIDAILAGVVGLAGFILGWRTVEAYGTALVWAGMIVLFFGCFIGIGGFSARVGDTVAYSIGGDGGMPENLTRLAESGQSSLGCFFLLLFAGIGLLGIGYLLPLLTI